MNAPQSTPSKRLFARAGSRPMLHRTSGDDQQHCNAPSFQEQVKPALARVVRHRYYAAAEGHALFEMAAEVLGLYVVLVAGT